MSETEWTRFTVIDTANGGLPAASFEYPSEWLAGGQVTWQPQHQQSPVQVNAYAVSSDRLRGLEFIPYQGFTWPPMPMAMRGQNAAGIIQLEPVPPVDAVVHLVVPNYRRQAENLKIVSGSSTPETVPADPRLPQAHAQAHNTVVRVQYAFQGKSYDEEFRAKQVIIAIPGGRYSWQLTSMWCARAEAGELDALMPVFECIANSWQTNPQWQNFVQQTVSGLLNQSYQATNDLLRAGEQRLEMNRQASQQFMARNQAYVDGQQRRVDAMANPVWTQTSSTFSASEMMGYGSDTAASSDYSSHNQSIDSIREEQTVFNSANTANEKISNHYDHVWKDQDGNLQGTNDPSFDPNFDATTQQWTRAVVKKPGGG